MKQKDFITFLIVFIFLTPIFSQIVNEGLLKITTPTMVYFGDEYTNNSGATHNNNGDLYLNSNFINNGITSSTSGTTFFASSTNTIQTISGITESINFYNLDVNLSSINKKGVSVSDNFGLKVENKVNLVNGDLRLVGDAQLFQTHSGIDNNISTNGKLLKDRKGYASAYGYNHWSSPVNNGGTFSLNGGLFDGTDSSLNSFTPQQVLFNSGSPYNGLPSVLDGSENVITPLTINTTWLYKFSRGGVGSYSDWIKIDENGILNPGEGYTMKGTNTLDSEQNYVFRGVPNNGDYAFPISVGESSLLGNPYPSSLDCDKFINDNLSVIDALYFWVEGGSTSHNLADYLGGYATINLTAGAPPSVSPSQISGLGNANSVTSPTQYMAVGQGFFIEAIGDGNIVFKNSQRVFKTESSGESVHYKTDKPNKNISNKTNITNSFVRIGYENPDGYHRQIVLGFLPDSPADLNYNIGYDAIMTDPRSDDFFYIIDNDLSKKYVIQGVGAYDNSYVFPVGLTISKKGINSIMLDEVENFSDQVLIKDKVLNITYNLSEANCVPNLSVGDYLDRFEIIFQSQETLDIVENSLKKIKVFYNGSKQIIIQNKKQLKLNKISIYNLLGQNVLQVNNGFTTGDNMVIPFNYKQGIYLVLIETNSGKETFKIIN